MRYLPFVLFVTTIYLFLTSNLEWLNILFGVLIAIGTTLLLKPQVKPFSWRKIPVAIWAIIQYMAVLVYDIFQGGLMVAKLALSPKLDIKPAIISIPSGCETELAKALSAHAISISPGELVIEIDEDGVMYTHVLDVTKSVEYREQAQRLRRELLRKIFE
jgi:multicomponent Na+:H+ antiporter subunit E